MIKTYSIASNARRDARKLGLDPSTVRAADGGFVIGQLVDAEMTEAAVEPEKPAEVELDPAPSAEGGSKTALLIAALSSDWRSADDLKTFFGWQAHTLRGAISTVAKKHSRKVERRREGKTTLYRFGRAEELAE